MRNKIIYSVICSLGIFLAFGFKSSIQNPIQKIEARYIEDYNSFRKKAFEFNQLARNASSSEDLIDEYYELRKSFKRIEFIWSFLDKEYVAKHINGAPLPKVEPNAPDLRIIEPSGLQCIDELLFEEEFNSVELIRLTEKLVKDLPKEQVKFGLRDQQFLDASKLSIIRLAYISASGFDVPGSLFPFYDMQARLKILKKDFSEYESVYKDEELSFQLYDIILRLDSANEYVIRNMNFEKFDRVQFIREYLNPLYNSIVKYHIYSGYESYYEVTSQRLGVNLLSDNLINENLLDKEFFFSFPKDVDSASIVQLGKTLFYDPILSSSVNVSCGTCHKPELAFTDGVAKSITHHGQDTLDRNAPGLINAVFAEKYFYDLRTNNLINQIEHVVVSEKEMGTDPLEITDKISLSQEYRILFKKSFGSKAISYQRVALALASYVSILTDFNSQVDNYLLAKTDRIDSTVYRGMNVFYGKAQCATCHFGPTYAGLVPPFYSETESEVLGVPDDANKTIANADKDLGRFINIKEQTEFYRFSHKTTSVRNVKYTAPYMHNGVFNNLEELVDFYNDGGGNGWGFGLEHQTLGSDELNLTTKEKKDLIAFLNSLSSDITKFTKPNSLPQFEGPYSKWNKRKIE